MKQKTLIYHLGGWFLVVVYDLVDAWRNGAGNLKVQMLLQFSFCLSMMAVFYYCFSFVYPRFLKKGKALQLIIALLFFPLVFSAVRYLLEQVIYPPLFNVSNYGGQVKLLYYLNDNLFFSVAVAVVSAAIWSAWQAFQKQTENEQLRKEKQAAELAFLSAQINPHFLYNSLNYLYSLAYPVSDQLADAIIKLSELMRYLLKENADGKVELQQDVEYLQNYIGIYRLRFKDRFFVDIKTEGNLEEKRIASLMLIPFVENAFKHGIVDDERRPIKINLRIIGNRLMFSASNRINQSQKDPASGIGLANTRRRLQLIYPDRHELLISDNGESYKISLNITL